MAKKKKKHQQNPISLLTLTNPTSPIAEQYRTIRTNIQFASTVDQQMKTIVVTSAGADEGKTTTAANLAVVFAQSGQKVLLVDADMRKPTIYKAFHLNNNGGLSSLLSTRESLRENVQQTAVNNLSVLTQGPLPPNPSELLSSMRMSQIIEEAEKTYDIVLFDMPPVVAVTDAQIMASKVDGTILVIRENVAKKDAIIKAKELLQMVNAHILGVVYNAAEQDKRDSYYYYYSNK